MNLIQARFDDTKYLKQPTKRKIILNSLRHLVYSSERRRLSKKEHKKIKNSQNIKITKERSTYDAQRWSEKNVNTSAKVELPIYSAAFSYTVRSGFYLQMIVMTVNQFLFTLFVNQM